MKDKDKVIAYEAAVKALQDARVERIDDAKMAKSVELVDHFVGAAAGLETAIAILKSQAGEVDF